MIEIRDLTKVYGGPGNEVRAVDGVDLDAAAGRVLGVVGPSGAGKSTLIRCANLLERPTSGTVRVAGQDLTSLDTAALRTARRSIGMIFQHFNLLDSRTAAENVAYPLEVAGVGRRRRTERTRELLELVGLGERADARPRQLSGGQKQRVGIARALAAGPKVLLCDEATSALDPDTTRSILALLRRLTAELDLTVLLITHEMQVVKDLCDDVAVLADGRVVEHGTVGELATRRGSRLGADLLPRLPAVDDAARSEHSTVLELTLHGGAADEPVLSALVRQLDLDVNLLAGSVETIGTHRLGRLQIEVPVRGAALDPVLDWLRLRGLEPEVAA